MKQYFRGIREIRAWPVIQQENKIWFSDRIVGGLYCVDKNKYNKVDCILNPKDLKNMGISQINAICTWNENVILIPAESIEPIVIYDIKLNESKKIMLSFETNGYLDNAYIHNDNLYIVSYLSNIAVCKIDMKTSFIQPYYYHDNKVHKSWLSFFCNNEIFIPGTDERILWKFNNGKLEKFILPIKEKVMSIAPDITREKSFWVYTSSLKTIYRIDENGELLDEINTGLKEKNGTLFRIIPYKKKLIMLHSVQGIIIFDIEKQEAESIIVDKSLLVNRYVNLLPCIYLGHVIDDKRITLLSFANTTIELEIDDASITYKTKKIELPRGIKNGFIKSSLYLYLDKRKKYFKEEKDFDIECYIYSLM